MGFYILSYPEDQQNAREIKWEEKSPAINWRKTQDKKNYAFRTHTTKHTTLKTNYYYLFQQLNDSFYNFIHLSLYDQLNLQQQLKREGTFSKLRKEIFFFFNNNF